MSEVAPAMKLGDALDYHSFREASRYYLNLRPQKLKACEEQVVQASKAEADYEKTKTRRWLEIKHSGGPDGKMVSAAEADARVKGDDEVGAALVQRDLEKERLKNCRAEVEGVDEALATLRKVGDWSQALFMRGVE